MRREPTCTIYVLIDPRDGGVRYVGITERADLRLRLKEHLQGSDGNIPKREWISELGKSLLIPLIQPIETGLTLPVAMERETLWIQHYLGMGNQLVNLRVTSYLSYTTRGTATDTPNANILTWRRAAVSNTVRSSGRTALPKRTVTLDELITEAGLRKSELAEESRVNAATISRICRGQQVTRGTIAKLLGVLERHLKRRIDMETIKGLNIIK